MALQNMEFTFPAKEKYKTIKKKWSHTGVVGSGDMEVLLRPINLEGGVKVRVVTPVTGFDALWEKVLARFIEESGLGDVILEINDNNSTPFIVSTRLRQALMEAEGEDAT